MPFISSTGTPSATLSSPFLIEGNDLIAVQTTQILYSLAGRSHLAFHGGTLCVKAPFTRFLPVKQADAGGMAPCSGTTLRNFNNRIQTGVDPGLTAGQRVTAQYRQRDPDLGDSFNDTLTNGIEFRICP